MTGRGARTGASDSHIALTAALEPIRTLDVACGTGFLPRHLRGDVVGIDQSPAMSEIARRVASYARVI
jgi:SAM-dependent methyltransferase